MIQAVEEEVLRQVQNSLPQKGSSSRPPVVAMLGFAVGLAAALVVLLLVHSFSLAHWQSFASLSSSSQPSADL